MIEQDEINFYSYKYIKDAARLFLKLAEEEQNKRDQSYYLTATMLFSGLYMESCLNHLLSEVFDYWEILKEKLSPYDKLQIISSVDEFKVDYSKRPFQTFKQIFRFRNWIAHAKTEILEFDRKKFIQFEKKWEWEPSTIPNVLHPRDGKFTLKEYMDAHEKFNLENRPRPKWFEMLTLDMAKRFVEDSEAIEGVFLPGAVGRARRELKKFIKAGELLKGSSSEQ